MLTRIKLEPDMNITRYLKIANYLRKRYTQAGSLIVQRGHFMSLPVALDYAAARRYLTA